MTATAGDDAYPSISQRLTAGVAWPPIRTVAWPDSPPVAVTSVWLPVTSEMLHDAGQRLWELPHRNPMPRLTPFPRLARLQRRARAARERIADTWGVLRHGLPETDW